MSDVTAEATQEGTVVLTISDDDQEYEFELAIDLAEKLKAQMEAALVIARVRARQ
jgi:hypothetical protein